MSIAPSPLTHADATPVGSDVEYATEAFTVDIQEDLESVDGKLNPPLQRLRSFVTHTGPLAAAVQELRESELTELPCISFHDLCYEVPQRKAGIIKLPNKKILKSVK